MWWWRNLPYFWEHIKRSCWHVFFFLQDYWADSACVLLLEKHTFLLSYSIARLHKAQWLKGSTAHLTVLQPPRCIVLAKRDVWRGGVQTWWNLQDTYLKRMQHWEEACAVVSFKAACPLFLLWQGRSPQASPPLQSFPPGTSVDGNLLRSSLKSDSDLLHSLFFCFVLSYIATLLFLWGLLTFSLFRGAHLL